KNSDPRYHVRPNNMKTRLLFAAVLLPCLAALSWSAGPQITVLLKLAPGQNPDTDAQAKAAQLQLGELLSEPSTREILPGPVVKLSAAKWSTKVDQTKRKAALDSLTGAWGDRIAIQISGDDSNG